MVNIGTIKGTKLRVAVPFANLYPEDKLWFILAVLAILALGAVLVHHGLEKAHQVYGITPNETEDGTYHPEDIIYWTYNVTAVYHQHIENKDTGKVFNGTYPVIETIACGDVNGRRDLFVVELCLIADKSIHNISDALPMLDSGTNYIYSFECIENCHFDPEMEKKCRMYSEWDDVTPEEVCWSMGGRWNGSDCRVPTGGRGWGEELMETTTTSLGIHYPTANNYSLILQGIRDEWECVGKCKCHGVWVQVGSGEPCELCVQECLFATKLSHDYFKLMSDLFHKHPYIDDVWDCSNISWGAMKGLQERGYDAWYCGGFYRNNISEAHAWLFVKRKNKTFYLDSGVIIPYDVYIKNYDMVNCSNETYFDTVTIDLDENEAKSLGISQ